MAINQARVSVGTSATLLDNFTETDSVRGTALVVQNLGTASVYLGNASVTTSTYGYELKANSSLSVTLQPEETLYGVVASGTVTVSVLAQGV